LRPIRELGEPLHAGPLPQRGDALPFGQQPRRAGAEERRVEAFEQRGRTERDGVDQAVLFDRRFEGTQVRSR
jgi:hypothetical protein